MHGTRKFPKLPISTVPKLILPVYGVLKIKYPTYRNQLGYPRCYRRGGAITISRLGCVTQIPPQR